MFAECCKGVQQNPGIFGVAFITFAMLAAFLVYWVASFIFLYSIPTQTVPIDSHLPQKFNQSVRNLMYFQVFACFWVMAFISAIFQMSVAGSVATWYFSRDAHGYSANVKSPAFRSFSRALTFSFGSLAFGSLLLAIVQFLSFVVRQARRINSKTQNKIVGLFLCIIQCFLNCIERIVKFIDRFTYIYIAMHGDSFCTSARNCYDLISRNMFSAVVVDFLGDFVLFVGKLLGTAICTLFTFGLLDQLGRPISPVTMTVTIIASYRIFALFASIVSVGVDTVFVCYLEDLERNKEGGLYMDPDLHRMLQEKAHRSTRQNIVKN